MATPPLERLAGSWEFEPLVDGQSAGRGRATFEWPDGGAFLVQRSEAEWTDPGWAENAPVSDAILTACANARPGPFAIPGRRPSCSTCSAATTGRP